MLHIVFIHPAAAVPVGRRQLQQLHQLIAPLLKQGLGGEHQDRTSLGILKRHQQGSHCQLDGFAQAHLIGQHQASTAKAMALQGQAGEVLLMGPETLLAPVDRCFHRGGGGGFHHRAGLQLLGFHHLAVDDPLHIVLDERAVRQGAGTVIVPEGVELLLHPGDRVWLVAFPEQLVVELPGAGAFVDAAEEGGGGAIGVADHAGFAVNQPEGSIRQHPDLDLVAEQRLVERLVAR